MAAASYTTDLTLIHACDASSASWTEPTGFADGAITLPETDYFIQGTGCLSKNMGASASAVSGAIYNAGSGLSIPTPSVFLAWVYFGAPNALATQVNGGLRMFIGSATSAFKQWYIKGSNTYTYGGWLCVPIDPSITQDATTGSPTATLQYFGGASVLSGAGAVSKGNPFGMDSLRYGRAEMRINGGDLANGYATFAGFATQNDSSSNRWGIFQAIDGGYLWQGLMNLGYTSAVDFRDSNVSIQIANTQKVASGFNKIEIRNASSRVDWTGVSITALGTTSKGGFEAIDDADINFDTCTFTDMNSFIFKSLSTVDNTTFRRCGQITANSAALTNCSIESYSGASNTSAVVWDTNLNPNGYLDGTTFTKGTGTTHAIEFGTTSPTSITLTNVTFSGYNASNGQNDSAIHIKRTTGTVTVTISGGTSPSYRTDGATVVIVAGAVNVTVTVKNTTGTAIANANVFLPVASGGYLPLNASVTISNSGTTATVTHTSHGLSTNDKVFIQGASLDANLGVFTIIVTGANTYTYTMASTPGSSPTGSITATFVVLSGLTSGSGILTMSRVFASNQPMSGWVRKSSGSPFYRTSLLSETVSSSTGASLTALMISDE